MEMAEMKPVVNPVIWIIILAFICNHLLNILIYKKRRKNEEEDKKTHRQTRFLSKRVPQSLGSLLVNYLHVAISVTVSCNNVILQNW